MEHVDDAQDLNFEQTEESSSQLFELRMPLPDSDRVVVLSRSLDELAARLAFDSVRKAVSAMRPRPKFSLELYFDATALDVFEQTREGEE